MRILGFIGLLVLILPSCKHECRKVVDIYEGGKEKVVHELPDCSDSTTYTRFYYHENGQLGSEVPFVNGVTNGKCKSWYENGVASAEWEQLDGKQNGPFKCWEEDGKLFREGTARNGEKEGIVKEWSDRGSLLVRTYKKGVREGYTYERGIDADSAIVIVIGQYANDKEEGVWKWFTSDSIVTSTKTFRGGIETGNATIHYKSGKVKHKGMLNNNSMEGEWEYYNEDGTLKELRYYEKDKLIRTKKI